MFGFLMGGSKMDPKEAVAKVNAGEITLIDVRDHGEVQMTGKAKGALVVPLSVMPLQCDPKGPDFNADIDMSKPVALYCASGARSAQGAQVLKRLGFEEVYNIGGLGHWHKAGGEVVR
ncbi:Rhodanese-related sulfurtransferase [Aliiroseovarius halocynthiae]|uniref:Sulfurtransferase n=1 Tax=Aliiroseovarius halocynthiae TaxID=985055 RepID=A0A545SWL0_9RHOB|nr:rhodanese-like domain-containing protein [Aliiroseovarius halocynthiae]TQV69348.1 sulfurtransferase [Aliiroseovarius halocynthiae]SMR72364.1 Rhodanese-related sulfurtransferase [Aliiroseovarius halocynthiae]